MAEYGGYDDDESPPAYGDEEYQELIGAVRRSSTLITPTQGTPRRLNAQDALARIKAGNYPELGSALPPPPPGQYVPPMGPPGSALPQTVAQAQGPGVDARRRADEFRQRGLDMTTQMPDMAAAIEANRRRSAGASEDLFTAMQLRSMGGDEMSQFANAIGAAAIKARQPEDVPGGWGTIQNGVFTPNAYKQREVEATRLLAMADDLDRRAALEVNEVERERAHRAAEDARNEARQMHQANLAEAQALRRQQFEQGKWQKVKDDAGNEILVNTSTGQRIDPSGAAGAPGAPGAERFPKLTEGQGKAMAFGMRAAEAAKQIEEIGDKYSPASVAAKAGLEKVPYVGGIASAGYNVLMGANEQAVEQAQRNFINAILRRESGALISEQEFANARQQYFPQPGDAPAVLEAKRRNRETSIRGLLIEAGPGARYVQEAAQRPTPKAPTPQRAFPRTRNVEADRKADQYIDMVTGGGVR